MAARAVRLHPRDRANVVVVALVFLVRVRSHGSCDIPTFSGVIYSATLLEVLSTERRLEVRKINGGQLRGRYENVLV